MKKGILFDLDGTLWDSSKEVAEAWVIASKEFPAMEHPVTTEVIQSVMGKPSDEIADIIFAEFPRDERMKLLDYCFEVENRYIREHGGQLFEGLEEMLAALKQKYHLYIVSNCQIGYIEAFLEYYGLGGYFDDFESFGATGRQKGENIRLVVERNHLERAVYVGDTQMDYDSAIYAGLPFIHARTGYGTVREEVSYIECLAQLPAVVGQLI